jgi:hypothetical protein
MYIEDNKSVDTLSEARGDILSDKGNQVVEINVLLG